MQITQLFDEPWKWADERLWHTPQFDVKGFQKKINDIVGLSRTGKPIVRLSYMRTKDCYERWYTAWNDAGEPTASELRAKYRFVQIALKDGTTVDIPPPRWVLEQRYEPEQLAQAWERDRWETVDGTARPLRDSVPADYYAPLLNIGTHFGGCCDNGVDPDGHVCWGLYRLPSDKDLNILREAVWRRDHDDIVTDAFNKPSEEAQFKTIFREAAAEKEKEERLDSLGKEVMGDLIRPHLHRFTDDPGVLKNGKYHFYSKADPNNKGKKHKETHTK